jgi:hypothetical protein
MLLVTVLLSLTAPARAASVDDPDLARGPLDLRRMVATKHDATAPLHLKLFTYGKWKARLLDVSGRSRLMFLFNSDRTGGVDFVGEIFFRNGGLVMKITTRGGAFVRRVKVLHPRRNVVKTTVPRGLPNPDGNVWLAGAEVYRSSIGPCSTSCRDRIPTKGWLKVTPGQ